MTLSNKNKNTLPRMFKNFRTCIIPLSKMHFQVRNKFDKNWSCQYNFSNFISNLSWILKYSRFDKILRKNQCFMFLKNTVSLSETDKLILLCLKILILCFVVTAKNIFLIKREGKQGCQLHVFKVCLHKLSLSWASGSR